MLTACVVTGRILLPASGPSLDGLVLPPSLVPVTYVSTMSRTAVAAALPAQRVRE